MNDRNDKQKVRTEQGAAEERDAADVRTEHETKDSSGKVIKREPGMRIANATRSAYGGRHGITLYRGGQRLYTDNYMHETEFRFNAGEYPTDVSLELKHGDEGPYIVKNASGVSLRMWIDLYDVDDPDRVWQRIWEHSWDAGDDASIHDTTITAHFGENGRMFAGKQVRIFLGNNRNWDNSGGLRNAFRIDMTVAGSIPLKCAINGGQNVVVLPGGAALSWEGDPAAQIQGVEVRYNDTTDGHWQDEWVILGEIQTSATSHPGWGVGVNPTRGHYRRYVIRFHYADGSYGPFSTTTYPLARTNILPNPVPAVARTPDVYEGGNITLWWNPPAVTTSAIAAYQIWQRVTVNGQWYENWQDLGEVPGTQTSWQTAPAITRGEYIQWIIRPKDACGEYAESWAWFDPVRKNMLPNTPGTLSVTPDIFTSVVNVWWPVPAVTTSAIHHYRIEVAVSNTPSFSSFQFVVDTGSAGQFTPPSTAGQYVQYRVKTVDVLGAESGYTYSNVVRMNTPPTKPGKPTVTPRIFVSGRFSIEWTASGDTTGNLAGYIVYAQVNDGSEVTIGKCTENKYSFTPEWGKGTKLRFFVQAYDTLGAVSEMSEKSDEAIIKPETQAPWFVLPTEEKTSLSKRPAFRVGWKVSQIGAETAIECRVLDESGTIISDWTEVYRSLTETEGTVRAAVELGDGRYRCEIRCNDGYATGAAAAVWFRVERPVWLREIVTGTVIADENVSHQADIRQAIEMANKARARVGLAEGELTDEVGYWANWQKNMNELTRLTNEACAMIGIARGEEIINVYPTAAGVNGVRELIGSV